jgi:hypothetical protein
MLSPAILILKYFGRTHRRLSQDLYPRPAPPHNFFILPPWQQKIAGAKKPPGAGCIIRHRTTNSRIGTGRLKYCIAAVVPGNPLALDFPFFFDTRDVAFLAAQFQYGRFNRRTCPDIRNSFGCRRLQRKNIFTTVL